MHAVVTGFQTPLWAFIALRQNFVRSSLIV